MKQPVIRHERLVGARRFRSLFPATLAVAAILMGCSRKDATNSTAGMQSERPASKPAPAPIAAPATASQPGNQILVLRPYWHDGTWVFDDERTNLVKEPFVSGVPEMIDYATREIAGARKGFRLLFSTGDFPGRQLELRRVREELGGNWYFCVETEKEGWLCPALFKYFVTAPERIYAKAEPIEDQ